MKRHFKPRHDLGDVQSDTDMNMSFRVKSLSLILAAILLWHYGGVRLYAQVRATQKRQPAQAAQLGPRLAGKEENRFDALLSELKEVISDDGAKTKAEPAKGFAGIERLNTIKDKLADEDEKNQEYFAQLGRTISEKKLPAEIQKRHAEFVHQYQSKYDALMAHVDGLESAHKTATGLWGKLTGQSQSINWGQVIEKATAFLDSNTPQPRPRQNFDPHNLPHRSLKSGQPIAPKLTREEWLKAFPKEVAPSGPTSGPTSVPRAAEKTGDTFSPLTASPPTPADLAETIEVKFTPEIRQLADSLGRNPVRIYNWVRNNIEFVPVWGSIQGAQLCLETRSCNAFDTASLLISLLRYSGVPALYQMGTIEVPVEKFKNWAGGFTNADAAASLFASGGVPAVVRRVNANGQVVTVRLEHVWVKAFVDYMPSGGAVNVNGDTWVELDASFKQYSFVPGVDFEAAVPSNSQAFVNQLVSTATIDPVTGSVTNINSTAIQPFAQQLSNERLSHAQLNFPNATMRDLFGGKAVVARSPAVLSATVPYRTLVRASEVSQIPDTLRHKVTFTLGSNAQTPDSADLWSYTTSLPELARKNVLLLYAPATLADEQLVRLSQNATSVPALVHLVPQLYVGSERVTVGRAVGIGSTVVLQVAFSSPTISTSIISNNLFAGEAASIGIDLQGISPAQMEALSRKAQEVRNLLLQQPTQSFTNRDFAEAFLSSNVMGWFATVDINNRLTSQNAGAVTLRYPSAGLFFMRLKPDSLFGATTFVSMDGLNMDIDRDVVVSVAKDGDAAKTARLNFAQGAFGSAMEAALPSRLVSTPENPISGVGTAQALKLANDRGVPVYQINSSNAATIIPLLQIAPDDLADVQDALNAGLEVTVSRTAVNLNGRSLLGIVIKDPLTGSANFLISGGTNGAIIVFFSTIMLMILTIGFIAGAFLVAIGLAAIVGLTFALATYLRNFIDNTPPTQAEIVIGIVALILSVLMFIAILTGVALFALFVAEGLVVFILTFFFVHNAASGSHAGASVSFHARNAEFMARQRQDVIFNLFVALAASGERCGEIFERARSNKLRPASEE
jgi:transglutaminase-like putative cysteine protease